jgi:hypothetical protein
MESYLTEVEDTLGRISCNVDVSRKITDNVKDILLLDALNAIGDARTVSQVLVVMKGHPDFDPVTVKGLEKLCTIIKADFPGVFARRSASSIDSACAAYSIVAAGGLEIILTNMELEGVSSDVLEYGCCLLFFIMRNEKSLMMPMIPPEFLRKQLGPTRTIKILIRTIKTRNAAHDASVQALLELEMFLAPDPRNAFDRQCPHPSYIEFRQAMTNANMVDWLGALNRRDPRTFLR